MKKVLLILAIALLALVPWAALADHNGLAHRASVTLTIESCGVALVSIDSPYPVTAAQVFLYAPGVNFLDIYPMGPLDEYELQRVAQRALVGYAAGNLTKQPPMGPFPFFKFTYEAQRPVIARFSIGGRYTTIVDSYGDPVAGEVHSGTLTPCGAGGSNG